MGSALAMPSRMAVELRDDMMSGICASLRGALVVCGIVCMYAFVLARGRGKVGSLQVRFVAGQEQWRSLFSH